MGSSHAFVHSEPDQSHAVTQHNVTRKKYVCLPVPCQTGSSPNEISQADTISSRCHPALDFSFGNTHLRNMKGVIIVVTTPISTSTENRS
jgi:hypothetical protein